MRIGIYNATYSGLGGAGQSVAVLAEALSSLHQVEVLHHNPELTVSQLAEFSDTKLESVCLRYLSRPDSFMTTALTFLGLEKNGSDGARG